MVQRSLTSDDTYTAIRYATLEIGEPAQRIEIDIDMLSSDFYVMTTTSDKGTPFNVFESRSFGRCSEIPACRLPSDIE
jgi:hypothetical protein